MTDFSTIFNNLVTSLGNLITYFGDQVASLAIGLAFIMSCIAVANVFWSKGYDAAIPAFKDQIAKFILVVALCLPINIGILSGSFITQFPKLILAGGYITANAFIANSVATNDKGGDTLILLPMNLRERLNAIQAINPDQLALDVADATKTMQDDHAGAFSTLMGFISGDQIKVYLIWIALLIVTFPAISAAAVLGGPVGWAIAAFIIIMTEFIAALIVNPSNYNCNVIGALVVSLTTAVANFLFVAVLTFTYYGVLISVLIKGLIFTIAFPITILTMPFESLKKHFVTAIVNIFAIALTPVIAVVIFVVATEGFAQLTQVDGVVAAMIKAYVGDLSAIPTGDVGGLIAWFFRWLSACFIAPAVLCYPIARYMAQAPMLATQIIGQGLNLGSSGLTEKMSNVGTFGVKL
jgi:hypothetical protein